MEATKQVYRSQTNRMIAGVAGGIGEYFSVDPTIIRLIFVILAIAGGTGVLAYIIGWVIIPEAPRSKQEATMAEEPSSTSPHTTTHEHHAHAEPQRNSQGRMLAGLILIALGAAFFIQQTVGFDIWHYAWPIILIVIGLFFITKRH